MLQRHLVPAPVYGGSSPDSSSSSSSEAKTGAGYSQGSSIIPDPDGSGDADLEQVDLANHPIVTDDEWAMMEDVTLGLDYDVARHLCGPMQDAQYQGTGKIKLVREWQYANTVGTTHMTWVEWQEKYGDAGRSTNVCMPLISRSRYRPAIVTNMVRTKIVGNRGSHRSRVRERTIRCVVRVCGAVSNVCCGVGCTSASSVRRRERERESARRRYSPSYARCIH